MPLYIFKCCNDHEQERIVKLDTEVVVCQRCRQPAYRTYNEPIGFRYDHTVNP